MSIKNQSRTRRAKRHRVKSRALGKTRLVVYRSSRHIYAQLIDPSGQVLCAASTLDKEVKVALSKEYPGNIASAKFVGQYIGQRGRSVGATHVTFDRSGYKYHGRVKALADAAREYIDF